MPISTNFTSVYSHDWEINFTQCAPNGYLTYVDLCNLLQLTAAEHSIVGGLSFNDMQVFDQAWVLSRMRVEISELPKWQDKVVTRTWIESLQGSGSIRNIEMYLDGKKIVGATTFWVVLNTKLRKPEALTLNHDHFEKFPELHATEVPFTRINVLKPETELAANHKVLFSDLDIVNHANNVKYMEWCFDAIDPKPLLAKEIAAFDINFLRELNLNDEVEIMVSDEEKPLFFSIKKDGKVCYALQLEWKSEQL